MKVLAVIGTRPEAIKMAPVVRAMLEKPGLEPVVVATAQHREMLDQVFSEFGLTADHDLNLMTPGQSLSELTARCIAALDSVVKTEAPDFVIAQGDTTTTFVASLVAFYHRTPFAHVEAGLRTYDYDNPYPEEFNRQVTSKLTRIHFAPTDGARDNLLREGMAADRVIVTGNTVIDALLHVAGPLAARPDRPARRMLVTVHRRENFGAPLRRIGEAIGTLLAEQAELEIDWPVHPNPNVHSYIHETFGDHPRVRLTAPLGYGDFVRAMVAADFILSDSGGVQEEAPALSRPVLVLREDTERPEAIGEGVARLVGTDVDRIRRSVTQLMHEPRTYAGMVKGISPYGDGRAAERIVAALARAC